MAAQDMLTHLAAWQGRKPESVAADTTYGNGEFLQWLADRDITPYTRNADPRQGSGTIAIVLRYPQKEEPILRSDRFIVRHTLELKSAIHVLIDSNLMEDVGEVPVNL